MNRTRYCLNHHTDDDLVRSLESLVARSNEVAADLLAHLAEVDARMLYAKLGYSSLFAYATSGLGLSEAAAFKRIQCARLSRRFPVVLDWIARGDIHLAGLALLAPHLCEENREEFLRAARHRSKRAIEQFLAARFPKPDAPTSLRRLPTPAGAATTSPTTTAMPSPITTSASSPTPATAPVAPLCLTGAAVTADPPATSAEHLRPTSDRHHEARCPINAEPGSAPTTPRAVLSPLSTERFRLQVTLSRRGRDLLVRAAELMRHREPSGDLAVVCERALATLVAELERQKFGKRRSNGTQEPPVQHSVDLGPATANAGEALPGQVEPGQANADGPAPPPAKSPDRGAKRGSRHIPNTVKRSVAERDGYQCTYVSAEGRRCASRSLLEFHHCEPFALGGASTVDRVTLRCRPHNQYAAQIDFGAAFMKAKRGSRSGPTEVRETRGGYCVGVWVA